MTNPLIIVGTSLLLVLVPRPACLAFQQPPPLSLSCLNSRTGASIIVDRRPPTHRNRSSIGSGIIARASYYSADDDDDDDEEEGYEIRRDTSANRRRQSTPRVETTFGADNVPVEQRPSNEYLNLIQQPTFGWASQESGDAGLVLRLAITYVAFFVLV
jgi:hypothetical protein